MDAIVEAAAIVQQIAAGDLIEPRWRLGELAAGWHQPNSRQRSDEQFAALAGCSRHLVSECRRVYETCYQLPDVRQLLQAKAVSWSHWVAAVEACQSAEQVHSAIEWVRDNDQSVRGLNVWLRTAAGVSPPGAEGVGAGIAEGSPGETGPDSTSMQDALAQPSTPDGSTRDTQRPAVPVQQPARPYTAHGIPTDPECSKRAVESDAAKALRKSLQQLTANCRRILTTHGSSAQWVLRDHLDALAESIRQGVEAENIEGLDAETISAALRSGQFTGDRL